MIRFEGYIVKIDDGYVEYSFNLTGSEEYSIQNILDCITKNTKLKADDGKITTAYKGHNRE